MTTRSVSFLTILPNYYCTSMESKFAGFFVLISQTKSTFSSRAIQYVERDGIEKYHTLDCYPPQLEKKMKLLAYFRSYMQENLIKAGGSVPPREGDELIRLPFLRQWFRTSRAVVMHLTNGTLQVKYFGGLQIYYSSIYRFISPFQRSIISEITSKLFCVR